MVGIVTHIRELADRMPVRLEVTKAGDVVDRRAGRGLSALQRRDLGARVRRRRSTPNCSRTRPSGSTSTVERPLADWAPIAPTPAPAPERILFVDGVRRIDARVWIHDGDRAHAGVCASVAAGVVDVRPARRPWSPRSRVDRALIAPAASDAGRCDDAPRPLRATCRPLGDDPDAVYLGDPRADDRTRADAWRPPTRCELVVFDGPLRGRNDPSGVGYVKTQHVQYLPEEVRPVLGRLGDGERTPLFLIGDRGPGRAWSWYLRLPGPRSQPLSGIVRCELPATGSATEAVARADAGVGVPAALRQPTRTRTHGRRRTCTPSPASSSGCATSSATNCCSSGRCEWRQPAPPILKT